MQAKANSLAESMSESIISPQASSLSSAKKTSTPEDRSTIRLRDRPKAMDDVPEEMSVITDVEEDEGSVSEVKLRLDISKADEAAESTQLPESQPPTARSVMSITEDIVTETQKSSKPESVSHNDNLSSRGQDGADQKEASTLSPRSVTEKSIKSQYSSEVDDESDWSISYKSEKSFTYSTSRGSKSELPYSEESSETTATNHDRSTKSSPRRKDHQSTTQSKKSLGASNKSLEDSIETEEEVSEQLEVESDLEEDKVLLKIADIPLDKPEPLQRPQTVKDSDPLAHLQVGDRVLVGGMQPGTLCFKGKVEFAPGYFGGVELDKSEGRNDGSKDEVQYFRCRPTHGIFAPPDKLERLPEGWKRSWIILGLMGLRVTSPRQPSWKTISLRDL